MLRQDLSGVAM